MNNPSTLKQHYDQSAQDAVSASMKGPLSYAIYWGKRHARNKYHNGLIRLWCWASIQLTKHPHASPEEKRFHSLSIIDRYSLQERIVEKTHEWIKEPGP